MGEAIDLAPLGIPVKLPPEKWKQRVKLFVPTCSEKGVIKDIHQKQLFQLVGVEALGKGTFSFVEKYREILPSGSERFVALKRPNGSECDFLLEALLQWHLHQELRHYGIEFCIPEVYSIFLHRPTGDIWFTMRAYEPLLVSQWCVKHFRGEETQNLFALLLLQIALILEVLEDELGIDHRDLKVNNMLIVEQPVKVSVDWKGKARILTFPFQIVLVDFGFSCWKGILDIKKDDGLPPLDACPKEGRDIFQVIASLWHISCIRSVLEESWGSWIRTRLGQEEHGIRNDLNWMYSTTESKGFRAPLCAPRVVIQDMMNCLEAGGKIETIQSYERNHPPHK